MSPEQAAESASRSPMFWQKPGATVYAVSRTGAPKEGVGTSSPGVIHVKGDIGDHAAMKALLAEITASSAGSLTFL